MTGADYCEKFSSGERVPSWIVDTEPTGPGPEIVLTFACDCYVLSVPGRRWIVPAQALLPQIRIEAYFQGKPVAGPVHLMVKWVAEVEVAIPGTFTILGREGPDDKGPPPLQPVPIGPLNLEPVK